MKLNRLKSVVNQVIRESSGDSQGYMVDPFYHYTPENEIIIDLKKGTFTPDLEGDDVERYYKSINQQNVSLYCYFVRYILFCCFSIYGLCSLARYALDCISCNRLTAR